jgi:polyisoprenoid-binding protein YceI
MKSNVFACSVSGKHTGLSLLAYILFAATVALISFTTVSVSAASSKRIVSSGTSLNLSAKGPKTITLNNNVGQNQIQFSSKAPLEDIDNGTATATGTFTLDPSNLEATTGKITVPVNSLQTGIALRDKHLIDKDWLDAASYPTITFEIKQLSNVSVVSSGNGKGIAKATAEGVFTLHGVSKPMSISIELTYVEKPQGDVVMIKASSFSVALKDHNITGKKGIIGSKVGEVITLKATLYGSAS